jgi:excisionase family DNA binding protein
MASKEVLTTGEVARMLKVTTNTVVKWFEAGLLKGYTFPGTRTRRIERESFDRFCAERRIPLNRIQREPFLTTGQCAKVCRVTVNTVTKWVDKKLLTGFTIESDRRLIFLMDLKSFMRHNRIPMEWLSPYDKQIPQAPARSEKASRAAKRPRKKSKKRVHRRGRKGKRGRRSKK